MKVFVLASLFIAQSVSASSYVIKYGHWQADATKPMPVSFSTEGAIHRSHYLSQPEFSADGKLLVFTEQTGSEALATDINYLEIGSDKKLPKPVRATPFGEFSATVYGDGYSVIRVEADGTQRLWQISATSEKVLLPEVLGVGYHAWGASGDVMMFLLENATQPNRAVYRDNAGKITELLPNPGRSFVYDKAENWFYFTAPAKGAAAETPLHLWRYRAGQAQAEMLALLPESGKDLAFTPQGQLMVSAKTQLLVWQGGKWQPWLDLSKDCEGVISRFKFNPTNTQLAFVCEKE
ncbi:MAG: hypothetical protein J0M22_05240 [Gammaproteobacteria bacterium]|nr:hypothetical protein [Gammaproteobacteria bacterium]